MRLPDPIEPDPPPAGDTGPLARRVAARMAELRRNTAQVVAKSGLSKPTVWRILTGEQQTPAFPTLQKLARGLDWDIASLHGTANDVVTTTATAIPIAGPAEVGTYRTRTPDDGAISTHAGRQDHFPPQPRDTRLQGHRQIAVPLLDDQLEGMSPPVPRGHTAFVAVPPAAEIPLESGRIYLVHRADSNGRIETTFRRLRIYPNTYEFGLMSPDAARNEVERIVVRKDELASSEIEIGGIFFASACVYC